MKLLRLLLCQQMTLTPQMRLLIYAIQAQYAAGCVSETGAAHGERDAANHWAEVSQCLFDHELQQQPHEIMFTIHQLTFLPMAGPMFA